VKYKKYPQYKDSGVKWLGEVPEYWNIKNLRYVVDMMQTGTTPSTTVTAYYNGNINWFNPTDLNNQVLINSTKQVTSKAIKEGACRMFPSDSVLIVGIGATAGKTSYLSSRDSSFNQQITGFHSKSNDNKYLFYLIKSFNNTFLSIANYTTLAILNNDLFKAFTIVVPSLQEQQAIANYLDQATAKIDTLIEKQTKLIEILKEKRQSLVDKIIHHETTQNQRLGYVVEKVLRPVQRKMDEEYESLGLYNRGRGLFHKPLKSEDELGDSDFYWVEEDDLILSGQFAWEGSVALATKNENNCIVSHRYPILRGKENLIDTEYLWAYFTTKEGDFILNEHSVGSAGRNRPLNINTLLKEKIPVPKIEEQREVAKIVKAERKIKILIDKAIEILKEKRTALISSVVTGKIDVRDIE
jgi:type I restriction enzyme S subunit